MVWPEAARTAASRQCGVLAPGQRALGLGLSLLGPAVPAIALLCWVVAATWLRSSRTAGREYSRSDQC